MDRRYPFALGRVSRKGERGQTILLVTISTMALLGMAALAVDVTTLYIARTEAEKAASAGALAGAKAFVNSGFTSYGLGNPSSGTVQSLVCNNSSGFADLEAKVAANQNLIVGKAPTSVTTACAFPTPQNPRITVTVRASGLPSFFSRIWGAFNGQVTAVASAEAYNPSGQAVPIQVASVKPWLVGNCDYAHHTQPNPNCPSGPADYFVDPANNYQVANGGAFIGQTMTLQQIDPSLSPLPSLNLGSSYYALDIDIDAASASCPAPSAVRCSQLNPADPHYAETIACANAKSLKCGDDVKVLPLASGLLLWLSQGAIEAPMCLIHASGHGLNRGQDRFVLPTATGDPITIDGGDRNPDTLLQGKTDISRSDSVVTVPLWNGNGIFAPGPTERIVGFMQLGIRRVPSGLLPNLTSKIEGVILNVSGCGSATGIPVTGGKISPIPVRLVHRGA